jgi:RNA polymerase sigma-70 factor (ECF subfamily)
MINPNISDEELVSILQKDGNLRYFSLLTDRYEQLIYRRCAWFVRDQEKAADLCQEVLIKLFLNLRQFNFESSFSFWLNRIIHNTCIDLLRRDKKLMHGLLNDAIIENIPDFVPEEDDLLVSDPQLELEGLLEQLPAEDKLILLLKYKENYSIKQLMELFHLSESAVKMRLKRARERIRLIRPKQKPG